MSGFGNQLKTADPNTAFNAAFQKAGEIAGAGDAAFRKNLNFGLESLFNTGPGSRTNAAKYLEGSDYAGRMIADRGAKRAQEQLALLQPALSGFLGSRQLDQNALMNAGNFLNAFRAPFLQGAMQAGIGTPIITEQQSIYGNALGHINQTASTAGSLAALFSSGGKPI